MTNLHKEINKWKWQDFSYMSLKNGMDSRRAAFLLYDFINMFGIESFQVIQTDGEWQNARITIVYIPPEKYEWDEIDDLWYEHIKKLEAEK